MRLSILFLFTTLLITGVFAQNPPPPPPAAISTTSSSEDVRATDGFKINFPSKPTRTVSKIETGFGKTDMISYQLGTNLAFYAVTFIDFPSVITDKAELELRFDSVKAALLKAPDSRLINEVEISFGGNPGAEFEIENKDTTITTRVLMIDQRFFQLTVVNRGRTSQATERVRNFNRKNIDRFINSFSVTQLPAPKIAAVELPPDFGIKIQDDTFTSDFFGFSIKLPTAFLE
jgi:hypothetical protein